MITRAQAEALLTLAESLEACAAVNIEIGIGVDDFEIGFASNSMPFAAIQSLSGEDLRAKVKDLAPYRRPEN